MIEIFNKHKKKFTLVELIIVIVVISILAGMAAPKFVGVARDAKVANFINDVDTLETIAQVLETKRGTDDTANYNIYATDAAVTVDALATNTELVSLLDSYGVRKGETHYDNLATLDVTMYKANLSNPLKTDKDITKYAVITSGEHAGTVVYIGEKEFVDGDGVQWFSLDMNDVAAEE